MTQKLINEITEQVAGLTAEQVVAIGAIINKHLGKTETAEPATHTITVETGGYNERRYGKPYIAVVDFAGNPQGNVQWGDWLGTVGQGGMLAITAKDGDIVMTGQKDHRARRAEQSAPTYHVVDDGKLIELGNKADAYKKWQEVNG